METGGIVILDVFRAGEIPEALMMLEKYGDEARLLAGGTEILPNIRHHAIDPKILIDIKPIDSLYYVGYGENGTLRIGSLTPLRLLERSPEIRKRHPLLSASARSIAALQIRNVGTVGGNLCQTVKCPYYNQSHVNLFMRQSLEPCRQRGGPVCHASRVDTLNHAVLGESARGCIATTASDLATPLMALDGVMKAVGPKGERSIPAGSFFKGGGRTALEGDEILTEIEIPPLADPSRFAYEKYSSGPRNFSILNVAVVAECSPDRKFCKTLRAVSGGMGIVPLRLKAVESQFMNREFSSREVEDALASDFKGVRARGSLSGYKVKRAEAMVSDAVQAALA